MAPDRQVCDSEQHRFFQGPLGPCFDASIPGVAAGKQDKTRGTAIALSGRHGA